MKLWTDGRTHLQLLETSGTLRLYRGKERVAEIDDPTLKGDVPLLVDAEAGRVYAGRPLVERSLDDLAEIARHSLDTSALTLLPDGRFATLEPGPMGPLLHIGTPEQAMAGDWAESLRLVTDQLTRVPQGVAGDDAEPRPDRFGPGARLVANEHGLAVADGPAGIVALLRPGATEFSKVWAYPATDITELSATPFEHGVVVVPQLAMRDAHVHLLLDAGGFAPLIQWGVACQAAVMGGHVYCVDERTVVIFGFDDLSQPVAHRDVSGRVGACAAGGDRFVVGFGEGIHIVRLIGDSGMGVDTIRVEERKDLLAKFDAELDKEVEDELLKLARAGMATRFLPDGGVEYALSSIKPEDVESIRDQIVALGATDVVVKAAEL